MPWDARNTAFTLVLSCEQVLVTHWPWAHEKGESPSSASHACMLLVVTRCHCYCYQVFSCTVGWVLVSLSHQQGRLVYGGPAGMNFLLENMQWFPVQRAKRAKILSSLAWYFPEVNCQTLESSKFADFQGFFKFPEVYLHIFSKSESAKFKVKSAKIWLFSAGQKTI